MSKKNDGYFDRDEMKERRAKKRAMREDRKEHWRFSPKDAHGDPEEEETTDWSAFS
jgi:hypothetical protein